MEPILEFWFELASTYSYIAASRIGKLCRDSGVRLEWKAFSLAPIFQAQGWNTSPFNLNPLRGAYMWRDMERLCDKFGLLWKRPSVFPKNTLAAARVAAAYADAQWIEQFIMLAYTANFYDDRDLNDALVVAELLSAVGADAQACLSYVADGPGHAAFRENTARAVERGLFGAPTCIVGGELFWGEETLEDAVAWALRHAPGRAATDLRLGVYAGPEL